MVNKMEDDEYYNKFDNKWVNKAEIDSPDGKWRVIIWCNDGLWDYKWEEI